MQITSLLSYAVQICEVSWFSPTIIYFLESKLKDFKDIQNLKQFQNSAIWQFECKVGSFFNFAKSNISINNRKIQLEMESSKDH